MARKKASVKNPKAGSKPPAANTDPPPKADAKHVGVKTAVKNPPKADATLAKAGAPVCKGLSTGLPAVPSKKRRATAYEAAAAGLNKKPAMAVTDKQDAAKVEAVPTPAVALALASAVLAVDAALLDGAAAALAPHKKTMKGEITTSRKR